MACAAKIISTDANTGDRYLFGDFNFQIAKGTGSRSVSQGDDSYTESATITIQVGILTKSGDFVQFQI